MKNKLFLVLLALVMLVPCAAAAENTDESVVKVYVSTNGKSGAEGTEDKPLNINGYQKFVQQIIEKCKTPTEIQVIFRGGEYRVQNQIVLTRLDSGFDDEHRVIYKAYDGEEPIFKGSRKIDVTKIKKVTDNKILKRLPESSRDKVGVIDLKEQGIEKITADAWDMGGYARIYLNNSEQMISQWPNGDYNYGEFSAVSAGGVGANTAGGSFRYENTVRPERWIDADDIVIQGYFGYDYRAETVPVANIDVKNSVINLKQGSDFGINNKQSRRWKAINLLEEIDMPGEWYIDRKSMLLYYYPPYGLDAASAELEMTELQDYMFKLSGASNITFSGLTFTQSGSGAIVGYHEPKSVIRNITVDKCTFTDLGNTALNFYTYNFGKIFDFAQWMNIEGNLYNMKITNNILYNIYGSGIMLQSGSTDKIEAHGVEVSNNYASRTAPLADDPYILLGTVDAVEGIVDHNLCHNTGFHVLTLNRIRSKARYNEIVATVRESVDAGAFYVGRTIMNRDNEYSYNFFYETNPVNPRVYLHRHNRAIYFDDGYAGGILKNNISIDGDKSFYTSGSGSKYYNNITVDHDSGMQLGVWAGVDRYEKFLSPESKADPLVQNFLKTFPEIEKEAEVIRKYDLQVTALNEVVGNLLVNSPAPDKGLSAKMLEANTIKDNIVTDKKDCFVDPDNMDYRVKKDSEVYKENPNLWSEDFDLSLIGIQWQEGFDKERILKRRNFRKLYPENGQTNVKTYQTEFMWENSFDADEYRFVLATDPNFENIVEDVTVPYNYYVAEHLESGYTDYYWQVTAINKTLSLKGEWDASGVVYRFTTTKYEFLDYSNLEKAIEKVKDIYPYITEGTGGGTFAYGTRERVDAALAKADEALGWKVGEKQQSDLEGIEKELLESVSEKYINSGIYNLGEYLKDESNWIIRDPSMANITFSGGEVTMDTVVDEETSYSNTYMECQNVDLFSKKVLYAFGIKADFRGANPWIGLSVRGQEVGVDLWSMENYFFAIKPDIIEVQLRGSGKSGIMETIPNTCLNDGEWHDIVFGAYDCGFGQAMVLIVDGKVIKVFIDSESDQITRTGGLKIYMSKPGRLSLRAPQNIISDEEMMGYINDAMRDEVANMCKQFEQKAGGDMLVTTVNSKNYYYGGKVEESGHNFIELIGGTSMVRAKDLEGILGITVTEDENTVTLERKSQKAVFTYGSKEAAAGEREIPLSHEVIRDGDDILVPLRGVSECFNMSIAYFQGLVGFSDTGYTDFINQMSLAGYTKTAFDTI